MSLDNIFIYVFKCNTCSSSLLKEESQWYKNVTYMSSAEGLNLSEKGLLVVRDNVKRDSPLGGHKSMSSVTNMHRSLHLKKTFSNS